MCQLYQYIKLICIFQVISILQSCAVNAQPTELIGTLEKFMEMTGVIEPVENKLDNIEIKLSRIEKTVNQLDAKVNRILGTDLDTAISTIQLARTIRDQTLRDQHLKDASQLLHLSISRETNKFRLLTAYYLSGSIYLYLGEQDTAKHQFKSALSIKYKTELVQLMDSYIDNYKTYGWKVRRLPTFTLGNAFYIPSFLKDELENKLILSINKVMNSNTGYLCIHMFPHVVDAIGKAGRIQFEKKLAYLRFNFKQFESDIFRLIESQGVPNRKLDVIIISKIYDFLNLTPKYKEKYKALFNACNSCDKDECCRKACPIYKKAYLYSFN